MVYMIIHILIDVLARSTKWWQYNEIGVIAIIIFIIESCTEHKQNIVTIMVQRSAPSNKWNQQIQYYVIGLTN